MKSPTPNSELPIRTYSANKKSGLLADWKSMAGEFGFAHSLGFRLAERNLRAKYRQSVLGVLWAFLPPLATAMVWIFLNSIRIVNFDSVGVPYPVFVLTGIMLWSIFSSSVLTPLNVVQSNRNILVKINFPREALLIAAFYEIVFNALVAVVIIVIELLIFQVDISLSSLLFLPCIFFLIVAGVAVGLLVLPVSLLYKDVQFVLPTFLQFCMYLTPVLYAKPIFSGMARVLDFNPITPLISSARGWLLGLDGISSWTTLLLVAAAALVLLFFGIRLLRLTITIIIERMGS